MCELQYTTIYDEYNNVPKEGNYHIIDSNDNEYWYVDGLRHRDNDLPAVIWYNGTQEWYQNDKLHRDNDKPAVINTNGSQYWYNRGLLHRVNNPSIMWGYDSVEYWYDNVYYTKQEYFDLMLAKGLISEKEYFSKLL